MTDKKQPFVVIDTGPKLQKLLKQGSSNEEPCYKQSFQCTGYGYVSVRCNCINIIHCSNTYMSMQADVYVYAHGCGRVALVSSTELYCAVINRARRYLC